MLMGPGPSGGRREAGRRAEWGRGAPSRGIGAAIKIVRGRARESRAATLWERLQPRRDRASRRRRVAAEAAPTVTHFAWVTDIPIEPTNLMTLMRGARARWKIENETFNTLKNQASARGCCAYLFALPPRTRLGRPRCGGAGIAANATTALTSTVPTFRERGHSGTVRSRPDRGSLNRIGAPWAAAPVPTGRGTVAAPAVAASGWGAAGAPVRRSGNAGCPAARSKSRFRRRDR